MAEEFLDIEVDQEDPKDPFAKYGGKQLDDPFKKYGGKAIEKKNLGGTPSSVGGGRFPSVSEVLSTSNGKIKDDNKWVKPIEKQEQPTNEFAAIENVLVENKTAGDRVRKAKSYPTMQSAAPGAVPVNRDFANEYLAEEKVYQKQQEDAKNAVLKANKEKIIKPVNDLIASGEYKQFINSSGVFDSGKAIAYFDDYVKKRGGGNYSRDMMVATMKQAAEAEHDRPEFEKLLDEEYKKQGVDISKYGQSLFDKQVTPKVNSLESMKAEAKQKASEYFEQMKPIAQEIGGQYQQQVAQLNEAYKNGQIPEEEANAQLKAINDDYLSKIKELDNNYSKSVKELNKKVSDKYNRITGEIKSISESITSDKVWASIPAAEKKKIELAQEAAQARLQTRKNEAKKASDFVSGLTSGNPLTGLFTKSLASGWNTGLADFGDYLSFKGFDNRMVRGLQGKRTKAEELSPAEYSWEENPFARAITSSATSFGASLPMTGATTALTLASGGLGLPGLVTTVAAGLTGYGLEKAQNTGGVYREILEQTQDPSLAAAGAADFGEKQIKALPLYFISAVGLQNLLKGGLKKTIAGTGQELVEELPTEYYQGFTQAQATQDYKGDFGQYIKENPQLSLDVIAGVIGQSGAISMASKIYQSLFKKAPSPQVQFYTDMIQKGGVNVAITNIQQQLDNGIISTEEYKKELFKVQEVVATLGKIQELGLKGDNAKAFLAYSSALTELTELANQEQDPAIKLLYSKNIAEAKQELTEIASGKGVYAVVTLPGGNNSKVVMPVENLTDTVIKNAEKIEVKNDKLANKDIQDKKKELGFPEDAPEGMYESTAPQSPSSSNTPKEEVVSKNDGGNSVGGGVVVPEKLGGIVKVAKNKAGNNFYTLKSTTKWFGEINKFFKDNYGIDDVLYNFQNKKSKEVDANGYYTLPDGTRVKETADSKTGDRTIYIQSEKFNPKAVEQSLKEQPKAEGVNTKEQVGSGVEKVKSKEASNEEPPLPEGETIVTLSGMTEAERQNKIAERQGQAGLNEIQKTENRLAELSYKTNNLRAGSEKSKAQSSIHQEVRKLNAELGYEKYNYDGYNVRRKRQVRKGTIKGMSRWVKLTSVNKDVGNQSIKKGGKTIRDRSVELQNNFDNLVDVAEHLEVMDANGRQMTKGMIESAIQDIYDGIPSVQAENLLDVLENGIENDDFPVRDNFTNQQIRLNDLIGTKSEILSEPLTEDAIEKWLDDESKLTPEQEYIFNKEFENILYEYPEIEIEVPLSETQSRSEKTNTPKVESKTADEQAERRREEWAAQNEDRLNKLAEKATSEEHFKELIDKEIGVDKNVLEEPEPEYGKIISIDSTNPAIVEIGGNEVKMPHKPAKGRQLTYTIGGVDKATVTIYETPISGKFTDNGKIQHSETFNTFKEAFKYAEALKSANIKSLYEYKASKENKTLPTTGGNLTNGGRTTSVVSEDNPQYGKDSPYQKALQKVRDKTTQRLNETNQANTKGTQPVSPEEKSDSKKLATEAGDGAGEKPPTGEPPKVEAEKPFDMNNKSLLKRVHESKNIPEAAKKRIEEKGLKYPIASKEEARSLAKYIISEFGIKDAVTLAESRRFYRGVNSAIFAEALDSLYTQEKAAKSKGALTNETTLALADQWSDIVLRYDEWLRDFGTEISFVADFYKKSPLGVKLAEKKKRDAAFSEWFDKREKNYKEVFEELQKDPEFEKFFKETIKEELKKERAEVRKARIEKVDKIFDDAKKKVEGEGGALYATIIPPKIMSIAIEGMKKAYHGGEKIAELIQEAIDYISEQMGNAPWDKEKFRKEWEEKLKDRLTDEELYQSNLRKQIKELDEQITNLKRNPPKEKTKKQWSDETKKLIDERDAKKKELNEKVPKISIEEKQQKFLEKWAKKLEGLSQKERAEVVRRSFTEIIENGALKYDKFKDIIADVLGLGKLSESDSAKMEKYVEDMNSLDDFEKKAIEAKTDAEKSKAIKEYDKAHEKAERSATDLAAILYNKPDIVNRLATIMQLKTLTATSLLKNPVYNIAFQATQRFWVSSTLSVLDQAIYQGSKVMNKTLGTKVVQPDYNVISSQKYYWEKMSKGLLVAVKQLFTGTTSRDYFQKEIHSQQIKPAKSWRDLIKSMRGELHLSGEQKLDKILQGTIGVEAEMVARLLNIGDKPFRFGAEAAIASVEANRLGLQGSDKELFIAFPKKMAYNVFKKQGLSEEKAQEKAGIVEKRIIREGEQAVFQQENVVSKLLTGLGQLTDTVLGGEDPVSKTFKGLSTIVGKAAMPFKKVPLNAAWELINVVVPELALAQSVVFATKAGIAKSKGQESARLDYISAKKWLATAIVGIGLQVVTNWLFKIGAVSGQDDDEDKKERDVEKLYTRPNSINLTKVLRVVSGGSSDSEEGDLLIDASWFGNVGIMANIQNNIREDMTPEEKEKLFTLFNDLLGRMDLAANEAIENGIFSTSLALLKAYSDRNTGFGNNVLMNMINTGTNIVQSGTFAQWSRAQMPYEYRLKADTFWQQLHNNMAARSGLYRTFTGHYPPARISIWGEQMDRENPVFMQQLGMKKNNKDNFAQPIWDDYEKSHNLKLWPPSVPKVITVNGERKKLNVEQQDKLQEFVGKQRQHLVAPFVNGLATIIDEEGNEVKFSEIKNEKLKIKLLQKIYKQGYKQGKILFQLANPDFMPQNPENTGEDEPEDG